MSKALKQSQVILGAVALILTACNDEPTTHSQSGKSAQMNTKSLDQMLAQNSSGPKKELFASGISSLKDGNYSAASKSFNQIVNIDPQNSMAHTLNGLAYQLQGLEGDLDAMALAEAAYNQARKYNETNSFAILQLGRINVARKNYVAAEDLFSTVLLLEPGNEEALYELANASYLMGDVKTSTMTAERLLKVNSSDPNNLRAGALIFAANGELEKSQQLLIAYKKTETDPQKIAYVEQRVSEINHLHASGAIRVAQATENGEGGGEEATLEETPAQTPPAETPPGAAPTTAAPAAAPAAATPAAAPAAAPAKAEIPQKIKPPHDEQMVVIDAIVMRVSENNESSYGQNVLKNFSVTVSPYTKVRQKNGNGPIGGVTIPTVAGGPSFASTASGIEGPNGSSWVLGKGISFGAINYGLNIANTNGTALEIVGRSSLTTTKGGESFFFSGSDIKTITNGSFGGSVVSNPIGSTLKVTVKDITPDGEVMMDVDLKGSTLAGDIADITANSSSGSVGILSIGQSNVKTNIRVKFDETIMLGGISSREDATTNEGVPILKEIPVLNLFFGQRSTNNKRTNTMYLLTARAYKENKRRTKNYFESGQGSLDEQRPGLTELEARHKDWFSPLNNHIFIFREIAPLYPDFRVGDMVPIYWAHSQKLSERLQSFTNIFFF